MATAGSIVIDLAMRTGLFETDTKRAEKRLQEMQKTAKQVGAAIGTAFVAAGTALITLTKNAIDNADAMRDMSIRLGTSTETLSAFGYAASQTGTDIDTLGKGMKVLSKNLADSLNPASEQAKVFEALGIKVTDAEGKLKDLSEIVPEIADRFKLLEDGTTKAALAQALFGKAGLDLIEFLNSGSQGLKEYEERMRSLGIEIDGPTADAADKFNDRLGDAKALVGGLGLALAKELLPDLNRMIGGFTDGAGAGDKLAETAKTIADVMRGVGTVVEFIGGYFTAFGNVIQGVTEGMIGLYEAAAGLVTLDWNRIKVGMGIAQEGADLAYYGETSPPGKPATPKIAFAGIDADPQGMFRMSAGEAAARKNAADLEKRVASALSNPTAKSPGKSRAKQLSEEEKEAKRLLETYGQLNAGFAERIALFGKEGEAVKIRYDIEHGELAKLQPAQQAVLVAQAERLDQMQEEADLVKKLAEADKDRQELFDDFLGDLALEREMLGKTREEQELLTAARYLGAEAATEQGQAALQALKDFQAASKATAEQVAVMDDIRDGFGDFFTTIIDGSASASDAFKSLVDDILASLTRWASNKLVEQFLGSYGSTSPGSSASGGFDWGALIGAVFGGAKAGGGDVINNRAYLVGEQGPEMFLPRTAGRVVPADETARMGRSSGGGPMTLIFNNPVMTDKRSDGQRQQEAALKLRLATRNS